MKARLTAIRNVLIGFAWVGTPVVVIQSAKETGAAVLLAVATLLIGLLACSLPPPPSRSATSVRTDLNAGVDAWERGDYATAYQEWKTLGDAGNADAQYKLGVLYYHAKRDYANAAKWLYKAAEQGHPLAQHDLGSLYVLGLGVPQSDAEAAGWFQLAAEQGHPMAQYNLGASYYSGEGVPQDYAQAAVLFRKAAIADIAMAQQNLGSMYVQGLGVQQDYQEGVKWFQRAAEQSVEEALNNTGAFQAGHLGRKFPVLAGESSPSMEMYREGITYILAAAKAALGELYAVGLGVPRDYVQAHKWFDLAATSLPPGDERALFTESRDYVAVSMTRDQIAEAQRMAREWLERPWIRGEQ